MPEVTIKYDSPKTLKLLKALSAYLGFSFSKVTKKKNDFFINGVPVIPGDRTADISEMDDFFAGRQLDAKKLRENAWRRNK